MVAFQSIIVVEEEVAALLDASACPRHHSFDVDDCVAL